MNILNNMNRIHNNEVNNISGWNALNGTINTYKNTKYINSNYFSFLHGYMNTCRGRSKFQKFRIFLDNGCISKIIMRTLITTLKTKDDYMMQCYTQEVHLITNLKVKYILLYLNLPRKNRDMGFYVDYSSKVRYNMVLGRDILTALVLNLKIQTCNWSRLRNFEKVHSTHGYSGCIKVWRYKYR